MDEAVAFMSLAALRATPESRSTREEIFASVGNLDDVEVFGNQVLVGIYIPPEQTKGGIIRPTSNLDENKYQGKSFLVLKTGPLAFKDAPNVSFMGLSAEPGDWVVGRVSDGWAVKVNKVECRMFDDIHIKMKVKDPEIVW